MLLSLHASWSDLCSYLEIRDRVSLSLVCSRTLKLVHESASVFADRPSLGHIAALTHSGEHSVDLRCFTPVPAIVLRLPSGIKIAVCLASKVRKSKKLFAGDQEHEYFETFCVVIQGRRVIRIEGLTAPYDATLSHALFTLRFLADRWAVQISLLLQNSVETERLIKKMFLLLLDENSASRKTLDSVLTYNFQPTVRKLQHCLNFILEHVGDSGLTDALTLTQGVIVSPTVHQVARRINDCGLALLAAVDTMSAELFAELASDYADDADAHDTRSGEDARFSEDEEENESIRSPSEYLRSYDRIVKNALFAIHGMDDAYVQGIRAELSSIRDRIHEYFRFYQRKVRSYFFDRVTVLNDLEELRVQVDSLVSEYRRTVIQNVISVTSQSPVDPMIPEDDGTDFMSSDIDFEIAAESDAGLQALVCMQSYSRPYNAMGDFTLPSDACQGALQLYRLLERRRNALRLHELIVDTEAFAASIFRRMCTEYRRMIATRKAQYWHTAGIAAPQVLSAIEYFNCTWLPSVQKRLSSMAKVGELYNTLSIPFCLAQHLLQTSWLDELDPRNYGEAASEEHRKSVVSATAELLVRVSSESFAALQDDFWLKSWWLAAMDVFILDEKFQAHMGTLQQARFYIRSLLRN